MKYSEIPILVYHEISEVNNPWCISPANFKQQMQYLKDNNYKTITLNQLKEGLESNPETDQKLVVITFDDARKGVYNYAYPILKQHGFTATVYIVPSWIENENIPLQENYSEFLNWTKLKELSINNFEIGSHTFSHQNLTNLDENNLNQELELAEQAIFSYLNLKVKHFSYPYGLYNQNLLQKIADRYETSVTMHRGFDKTNSRYARQWILCQASLEEFTKLLHLPTLSLCMITKNEEQFLEQCLNSVKNLVDEIIIVDTGSTDKTKEIAAKFTAQIFDFKWCDDFSAARNESLKHAAKDWILILDADEQLDQPACKTIKEVINNWSTLGFRILTRNYSNDSTIDGWQPSNRDELLKIKELSSKSPQGWYPSLKVRLFQNHKNIKFDGQIHELVDQNIEKNGGKIAVLNTFVHHFGTLNPNKIIDKTKNYLKLTQEKIKTNPKEAKAYFELGVQYKNLGELKLAEDNFQESLRLEPNSVMPLLNLAIVQQKQNKIDEAIKNYSQALKIKENFAEAYFGLGFCYFKKNLLEKSKDNFELAIKNKPTHLDAYVNLGAVYEKLNQFKNAVLCYKKALLINPKHARTYYNLGVVHERTMNLPLTIKCYEKALELNYSNQEYLVKKITEIKQVINKQEEH